MTRHPGHQPSTLPMAPLPRLTAELRTELVAYLDGELDEQTNERIEQTVAGNEVARREIERLSRVYDLLDELPLEQPSQEFTQTTVSAVRAEVVEEGSLGRIRDAVQRWKPVVLTAVAATLVTTLGTVLGSATLRSRSEQRLRLVPVARDLPKLEAIGEIEFVTRLQNERSLRDQLFDAVGRSRTSPPATRGPQ